MGAQPYESHFLLGKERVGSCQNRSPDSGPALFVLVICTEGRRGRKKADMTENVIIAPEYEERAKRVISEHADLAWIENEGVRIAYLASDKEKKSHRRPVCGQCVKVPNLFKVLMPYDFLIVIYEVNTEGFTDAEMDVLLYHELLHIGMNDKGEFTTNPHDINDFSTIVRKYGIFWAEVGLELAAPADGATAGGDPDGEGQI